MRKLRFPSIADLWRPFSLSLAAIAVAGGLMVYRLGTITPGLSVPEAEFSEAALSLNDIVENPLHIAHKVPHWLLIKLGVSEVYATRLPSAAIGLLAIIAFYLILSRWHTARVATLGTALFATSSWLLHTARLGTNDASFLLPLLLILGGVWLHKKEHIVLAPLLSAITAAALLYVPAMVWLVLPAAVWQRRRIKNVLQLLPVWWQAIVIVLAVLCLVPLIWAVSQDSALLRTWLGLPATWPTPGEFLRNLWNIPVSIFVKTAPDPVYGIGRLPLLDVFTSVMVLFGIYAYAFRLKLDRTRLVLFFATFGALFIALDGPVALSIVLPFTYVLAAAGVAVLLQRWFTVFPRNPFARGVAVVLMTAAVGMACFYHLTRYFVAWPDVPETKQVFRQD